MARTERHKIRYLDMGVHSRTFPDTVSAINFVGELDKGEFIDAVKVTEEPLAIPGMSASKPASESFRIRYVAEGVRTKTCETAGEAAEFVASIPQDKFLSIVLVIEEDQPAPHIISRINPEPGARPQVPLPQFSVPSVR